MRYALIGICMTIAFAFGLSIPMKSASKYALVQKQNGGIIVLSKDLSAVNCGYKKQKVSNGYCVTEPMNQKGNRQ